MKVKRKLKIKNVEKRSKKRKGMAVKTQVKAGSVDADGYWEPDLTL